MIKSMFSVIMPVFNKQDYVLEAVQSVLSQTYAQFELLVIDDGSTDDSAVVLSQIFDKRVRLFHQKNIGVAATRNRGIEEAQGLFVCFLDADDIWDNDYLLTVSQMIESLPQAVMYATSYYELLPKGRQNFPAIPTNPQASYYPIDDFYNHWRVSPFTFTSAITLRRDLLMQERIRFPVGESAGEDQDVWFRIVEGGVVVFSPKRLVMYRRDVTGNLTASAPTSLLPCYQRLSNRLLLPDYPQKLKSGAMKLLGKHRLDVAWVNILSGRSGTALRFIFNKQVVSSPVYLMKCLTFLLLPFPFRRLIYTRIKQQKMKKSDLILYDNKCH